MADSAFGFPFNFLFFIPSVLVSSEFFVDDIVHFFDGESFNVFLREEQGHRSVCFAQAFVQADLSILQVLSFEIAKVDGGFEMLEHFTRTGHDGFISAVVTRESFG